MRRRRRDALRGTPFRSLPEALDAASAAEPDIPDVKVADVMMYIYTSGTTGYPKPTIIRHARFTMGGQSLRVVLELGGGRLLVRADAALPRLLELRRLRAGAACRHDASRRGAGSPPATFSTTCRRTA